MTPERWQQIDALIQKALDCTPANRAALLAEACGDDGELRREVETLIGFHERAEDFIEAPPGEIAADWLAAKDTHAGQTMAGQTLAGQTLGRYELIRPIGRGGMGEVYLAHDSQLQRQVALKLLPERFTQDPERVRRFRHEARAVSGLNHPNILTIYEVAETKGVHYLATEYVAGKTLRALLEAKQLTLGATLDIAIQVGEALAASHRAGIIHRDIKPENLMQRADGYVKVLDFGLAKLTETLTVNDFETNPYSLLHTQLGMVLGTARYMSPEQARGEEVDARTDIFSFGVVLYEMLTGCVPFAGATPSDVIAALLEREPLPLDAYSKNLPADFQRIVQRALQKKRADRYADIGEMLGELRTLKEQLELSANLKRSKGESSHGASLLEMRVGTSKSDAEAVAAEQDDKPVSFAKSDEPRRFSQVIKVALTAVAVFLVLAFALAGLAIYRYSGTEENDVPINSIAVLPFADNTNDAQLNYLPDGLTESLINSLSRLPKLRVMASGSVFTYKGHSVSPQQVGQELKVRAVVNGRVQKAGDRSKTSTRWTSTPMIYFSLLVVICWRKPDGFRKRANFCWTWKNRDSNGVYHLSIWRVFM